MDANNVVEPIVFVIATAVLPMILLNLVIAIMSDTYEKVITNIEESDNKQKNSIILSFENYMFWKRVLDDNTPKHLFWFEYSSGQAYEWVSQVDHIINGIKTPLQKTHLEVASLKFDSRKLEGSVKILEKHITTKFEETNNKQVRNNDEFRRELAQIKGSINKLAGEGEGSLSKKISDMIDTMKQDSKAAANETAVA